ncbi:1,2-phenylacetyl-CoA epoxidase subunit PaaD [Tsukamurella paurometabola]|uniref:Phenylacetate-CoA oxygenase, PaaJ subunit n=1 Tax=Tsukamurella paurometabola TaxID=2061 RepID=A0A3P8LCA7_TSUPA|nr:1,2-phenylacetyl-CoA epoxidase subunit PaaD [Tsukamurella paurometabola]UEA84358.1 phenylacetate-CoA oxygenase subunit PaaJ [Tsukamurella paurometabola]VDR36922.1 phenylacetate-CoA oxygenase, PaaJ subunit [Tsukamurella paurometabola]
MGGGDVAATATRPALAVVADVLDPEMPQVTLADLGIVRDVSEADDGAVTVTITPTYSGCPAMGTIRADIEAALHAAGYPAVTIVTALSPAWSTDWITDTGRAKLRAAGYSAPGPAPRRGDGPVPLTLQARPRRIACPACGSTRTRLDSEFSATPCKALYRCLDCREPFDHVKEI